MTMEFISEIMDAMVKGTLCGIYISFWLMGLSMIWKWFLGVVKRFLRWLFPKSKWFQPNSGETKKN